MKKFSKRKIVLINLVLILSSLIFINPNFNSYHHDDYEKVDRSKLELAGYWNFPFFIIDDTGGGNYTWAEAALESWCNGLGTWNDPYIIENMTVDGVGLKNCLTVSKSTVFFRIRNCTLLNAKQDGYGIYLDYVANGTLFNNTCVSSAERGILVYGSHNISIIENRLNYNDQGISIGYSDNITVLNNIVNDNNVVGITLSQTTNAILKGNRMIKSGLRVSGMFPDDFNQNFIDTSNTVNDKPIYYYLDKSGLNTPDFPNAGQIILVNCTYSVISGFDLSNGSNAIQLIHCNHSQISWNTILNTKNRAIDLTNSFNNTIFKNNIDNSYRSIMLNSGSCNNTIINNNVTYSSFGVEIYHGSNNNTVSGNRLSDGYCGIYMDNCYNNTASGNILTSNLINAIDHGIINYWDNGSLGNYYSDYGGVDADDDGIGDTPHNISGTANNKDYFPIWDDGYDSTPIFIDGAATGVGAHNWTWAQAHVWCSGSGTFTDPYTLKDLIIDGNNLSSCISIQNSNEFFAIENCRLTNSSESTYPYYDAGIKLFNVNNGMIFNNTCSNNQGNGITFSDINNCSVVENIASTNLGAGIYLKECNNNNILGNTLNSNGYGISSFKGINNTISYNTAYNNWGGISLSLSFSSNVSLNSAYNNTFYGIGVHNSDSNTVSGNTANYNDVRGIELGSCNNSALYNNTVNNNGQEGIMITFCYYNNITGNQIFRNDRNGITFGVSENNILKENIFKENDKGIETLSINLTTFYDNKFIDNFFGLSLNSESNNNTVYNNLFLNNPIGAYDDGKHNKWDNGSIGNFWSDYPDKDINDDGIGDSAYNVSGDTGSQDNYPIWWDPPLIIINSPEVNEIFENNPFYNISIAEGIADAMWYTLNAGLTNNTFGILTGFIDPTIWNNEGDGPISIGFYTNDSRSFIGFSEITVIKETATPIITIITPENHDVFGAEAPTFELSIIETNLELTWYSLDGGMTNTTFTGLSGTINQNIWDNQPEGDVTITFYAKDVASNLGINSVLITKQIIIDPDTEISDIPGYNIFLLFGITCLVSIFLLKKHKFKT